MTKFKFYLLQLLLLVTFSVYSQSFDRFVKKGDDYFEESNFQLAAENYDQALGIKEKDVHTQTRISQCYIKLSKADLALDHALKAKEFATDPSYELLFTLGAAYHLNHRFDKAKEFYKASDPGRKNFRKISYLMEQCDNGKKYVASPGNYKISNMGRLINSKYHEYLPKITADGKKLYFTSRRSGSMGDLAPDGDPHEDIYLSEFKGGWTAPKNIGKPLNTDGHNACIGLSEDGQTMFLYHGENGGDIFISRLHGSRWASGKAFPYNSPYFESSVSISPDERLLFYVRQTSSGGDRNIYVCRKTASGNWSKPVYVKVNTGYDEESPYIHPDGKTLYFSSKGHSSMGGYDIFKVEIGSNGQPVSEPVNLGYPINTAGDDLYFVLSADGRVGFYSSEKEGGYGKQDIYSVIMPPSKKPDLALLKGKVMDEFTGKPIEADITITDNSAGETIGTYKSNSETGEYMISLPAGKNYGITVEKDDHLFFSENVYLKPGGGYKEFNNNIKLVNVKPGNKIILKNIFFDSGEHELRPESVAELNRLVDLLEKEKTLKIEISGHTDNIGDANANLALSKRRAENVVAYLTKNGIAADRLSAKGYGSSKPIASNNTASGRQQNRRTEFKIISR